FKGLALLDPALTNSELSGLKENGFTGFRVKTNGKGGLSFDDTSRMIERVKGFGWHIEFMSESIAEVLAAVPFLRRLNMPYVFDHVAHVAPATAESTQFTERLRILNTARRASVKPYS